MNLTNYNNVAAWLKVQNTTDQAILQRMIAQTSQRILNYINKPDLTVQTFNETISGRDTSRIILRNYPVISITSLTVDTVLIPQSPGVGQYGWTLTPLDGAISSRQQELGIDGWVSYYPRGSNNGYGYQDGYRPSRSGSGKCFPRGINNIVCVYQAGYGIQNEAQTIPATPYQLAPLCPHGNFAADNGVTYAATGASLTAVTGTPAAGQYAVSVNALSGVATYTFAAADTGKAVLLNYSFVPIDLEQCCIDLIAELYRYRDRIGQTSKSVGGQETTAFSNKMPEWTKEVLNQYRSWAFPT